MMLLNHFIKKPVWGIVIALFLLLMGGLSFIKLPVRLFPVVPASVVTITTTYPGANPNTMASFVTTPIQLALTGLAGVNYIQAQNTEGKSVITLKFFLTRNSLNKVLPQISDRVSSVLWKLPKGINSPIITKVNPNSGPAGDILFYGFYSKHMSGAQITDYLQRVVRPHLDSIAGVSDVTIYGKQVYAMRVWLNPTKMAAYGITATDIIHALKQHSLQSTAGQLKSHYLQFNINSNTDLQSAQAFGNIPLKVTGNQVIRIDDIGHVALGTTHNQDVTTFVLNNPGITMGVAPKGHANAIAVGAKIKSYFAHLVLPPDLHMKQTVDMTVYNRASLHEVNVTIILSALLVFIVILLFLGSLRAVLIPIVTIPLSLLGGCLLMSACGFSANSLTLLAWVLAIGLVVDDAIVVLENTHRHVELGQTPLAASLDSLREIKIPIIIMTLVVAIVFVPIGFMPGLTGALFTQFAYTLALIVLVSGILALFLTPMMCRYLTPEHGHNSALTNWVDRLFSRFRQGFSRVLTQILHMPWLIVLVFFGLLFSGMALFHETPGELIPSENSNVLLAFGYGPPDSNIDYLTHYASAFQTLYNHMPEMTAFGIVNGFPDGINQSLSFVVLNTHKKGARSEDQILADLQSKMSHIKGLYAFAIRRPILPGISQSASPFNIVLKTDGSYKQLNQAMQKLIQIAGKNPGLVAPLSNLTIQNTQINVSIHRQKAIALGVSPSDINQTLSTFFGMPIVARFNLDGRSYEIIPQVYRRYRTHPNNILSAYVQSRYGELVPLANLISLQSQTIANTLNQFQLMRSATFSAGLANGYTQSEAYRFIQHAVQTQLPHNIQMDTTGMTRLFVQSQGVLAMAFLLAIMIIYLLLAVFFNSLREPFIVMIAVPLAVAGALYTMYLTGVTLNIYTKIGLIMLIGLISKHGTLIVHFANQLQMEKGLSRFEAAIEAATVRLRPILMTTAAMIAGALPLIFAHGAGDAARQDIGWVIVGGMAIGTCLSLFVVPGLYAVLAKRYAP